MAAESISDRPTLKHEGAPTGATGGGPGEANQERGSEPRRSKASGRGHEMNVPVYNMQGAEVGSMSIDESALSASYSDDGLNPSLVKQAYVMYHANRRQGSARTKNRAAIAGSTAKMYKQKGTGRARHSTKKAPQFKGGGRAFAETRSREDYHLDMPKKMRRKANRNALLSKIIGSEAFGPEIRVIDDLKMDSVKTKEFVNFIGALNLNRSALVVLSNDADKSDNIRKSARNVADVQLCPLDQMTCFEMLNNRYLIIGKAELEAWINGASSQTGKAAKINPMGKQDKKPRRPSVPRGKKRGQPVAAGSDGGAG